MRSAVFLPMPGIRVSRWTSPPRIALVRSAAASPDSTVIASFGPMPLTPISFSNSIFSSAVRNPNKRDRVLANVRVDLQLDFLPGVRQRRIRGDGDGDVVPDTVDIHDDLVGPLFKQARRAGWRSYGVHYLSPRMRSMARRRFFVPIVRDGQAEIAGEDARHLTQVLRVEPGQIFEFSDNHAALSWRRLNRHASRKFSFAIIERLPDPAPETPVHLLVALFKFDRLELLLEKATELGVTSVQFVRAESSEKGLEQAAEKRIERWRRIVVEASQQSRRLATCRSCMNRCG